MVQKLRAETVTYLAYVAFLVGFIALGLFIYALTAGGSLMGVFGIAVVAAFAAAIVLFPMGARMRAEANDSGIEIPGVNIFATPLKRNQIDKYLAHYRGVGSGEEYETRRVPAAVEAPSRHEAERIAA